MTNPWALRKPRVPGLSLAFFRPAGAFNIGDLVFVSPSKGVSSFFWIFVVATTVIVAWLTKIIVCFVGVRSAFILGFGGKSLQ